MIKSHKLTIDDMKSVALEIQAYISFQGNNNRRDELSGRIAQLDLKISALQGVKITIND